MVTEYYAVSCGHIVIKTFLEKHYSIIKNTL